MYFIFPVLFIVFALFCLWLFAIAPQIRNRPDLSKLAEYDYAHRGLHNKNSGIPENSLAAFRLAAECGFGMEFDLMLSKDGVVMVHHDETLLRMCGVDIRVSALTAQQLRQYRLYDTDEVIPTFQETLDAVGRRTPLIIELKPSRSVEELCTATWDILKDYKGLYCIESFDPRVVKWFKENHPGVVRGQLMENLKANKELTVFEAFAGQNMLSNFLTRPNFEAYDYKYRSCPSLRLARKMFGMQEVSWTVRDLDTYKELKDDNCIIIFEGFQPYSDRKRVFSSNFETKTTTTAAEAAQKNS